MLTWKLCMLHYALQFSLWFFILLKCVWMKESHWIKPNLKGFIRLWIYLLFALGFYSWEKLFCYFYLHVCFVHHFFLFWSEIIIYGWIEMKLKNINTFHVRMADVALSFAAWICFYSFVASCMISELFFFNYSQLNEFYI